MIGGALYWRLGSTSGGDAGAVTETSNRSYTLEELARYDGKDGNQCLGEHLPSGGRARCGLDLTEVIDESSHGRSKLQLLEKVGALE